MKPSFFRYSFHINSLPNLRTKHMLLPDTSAIQILLLSHLVTKLISISQPSSSSTRVYHQCACYHNHFPPVPNSVSIHLSSRYALQYPSTLSWFSLHMLPAIRITIHANVVSTHFCYFITFSHWLFCSTSVYFFGSFLLPFQQLALKFTMSSSSGSSSWHTTSSFLSTILRLFLAGCSVLHISKYTSSTLLFSFLALTTIS